MENPLKQLKETEKKIIKVLNEHSGLVKENNALKAKLQALEKEMAVHKDSLKLLEQKIKDHNLAQSLNEKPDNRKLKQKINEYIREIDKCLALLNH